MSHSYSLSNRQARACRVVGALFLFAPAFMIALTIAAAVPGGAEVLCEKDDCGYYDAVKEALPDESRTKLDTSKAVEARFERHLDDPWVTAGLDALSVGEFVPGWALAIFVGIALRRLGARSRDGLVAALPWLRRAGWAALAMAVAMPLIASLRAMLLLPGIDGYRSWYFVVDGNVLGQNLMLAFAAIAVSWALSAGSRAQADIAEII